MTNVLHPFQLLVIALAGWLNRHQQAVIDYLIEENRVLKDQLDGQRLRFTDEQRIRLAVKAKVIGRRGLDEIEPLVTPDTLLAYSPRLSQPAICHGSISKRSGMNSKSLVLRVARVKWFAWVMAAICASSTEMVRPAFRAAATRFA